MMSQIPIKIAAKNRDKQVLRVGMIAELDAINLYEQMADSSKNRMIKKLMLDVAKEEKTHAGEFLYLLKEMDKQQAMENEKAVAEVMKLKKVV
jgi:rubrerythrin